MLTITEIATVAVIMTAPVPATATVIATVPLIATVPVVTAVTVTLAGNVGATDLLFTIRTLMTMFRRELSFSDGLYLWEVSGYTWL